MYKSNEIPKLSSELDQDENYEFTGATLSISNDEGHQEISSLRYRGSTRSDMGKLEQSAILSGSDVSSPPSINESDYQSFQKEDFQSEKSRATSNKDSIKTPGQYFSFRNGQFEKAVTDCISTLLRPSNDLNILGSWLLTEVSHWDAEKERIFILTSKSFLEVKYDFIALKILQNNKIHLEQIDTVLRGKLTYPVQSLVPRIEGITNGVASLISGSIFGFRKKPTNPTPSKACEKDAENKMTVANRFDFSSFRERKDIGVRLLWNRGQPLSLIRSWNPFSDDIPWLTIKDHPLYTTLGEVATLSQPLDELEKSRNIYSVESLYNKLLTVFSASNPASVNFNCCFEDCPILMENYVGIGAVIHNKNNFGFFKCRGKFSF